MKKGLILTKENLQSLCAADSKTQCWVWIRSRDRKGYGQKRMSDNSLKYVHRLSYELFIGPIVSGNLILHKCDNPPCCNPDHLFQGTAKDNTHDAMRKKRLKNPPALCGEKCGTSYLTETQVIEIRARRARGETGVSVAKIFKTSTTNVSDIHKRNTWKHLNP